jgi:hypothetical protein
MLVFGGMIYIEHGIEGLEPDVVIVGAASSQVLYFVSRSLGQFPKTLKFSQNDRSDEWGEGLQNLSPWCKSRMRGSQKAAKRVWRRGWDSNPRMEVLQTSPLGHLGTAPNE